jgi:DeoR/GlpR family transcriptional regulator of sugar metabolism
MLKIDRQNRIMNALNTTGSVLITSLKDDMGCHEETIRRDLKELEAQGKLKRIHGGAYLPDYSDHSVPTDLRDTLYKKEKQELSRAALSYVKPGDTIMLDSSTTCLQFAKEIMDAALPVTILTNSLRICNLCDINKNHHINLVCSGGQLRQKTSSFIGYKATETLASNYASTAFISNPAIDLQFGLSDTNLNEANVRNCMLQHSKQHIFLMDHTKFNKIADNIFAPLSVIDILITDKALDSTWESLLREKEDINLQYTSFSAS